MVAPVAAMAVRPALQRGPWSGDLASSSRDGRAGTSIAVTGRARFVGGTIRGGPGLEARLGGGQNKGGKISLDLDAIENGSLDDF